MKPVRFSLIVVILASLACLLGLTWILLSLISFKTAEKDLLAVKNDEGRIVLATFVRLVPDNINALPGSAAAGFAEGLFRDNDISGITVVDLARRPVYQLGEQGGGDLRLAETVRRGGEGYAFSADRKLLFRYAPFLVDGRIAGACRLTVSLAAEHARLRQSRHLFFSYFVLDSLLLVGFGGFLLSRAVVFPLRRLLAATERIAAGDYSHPVHVPGSLEIGALADSFNTMLMKLREKREEVDAHVISLEQANLELQTAREESIRSEKMASVGLLAAGMAHEIGTPLGAIMGYAQILRDEIGDDPAKGDYLQRIEADAGRIDRIVRDLLNYARPTPVQYEETEPAQLLRETVEMLKSQGVLKKVQVEMDVASGVPLLFVDRHQLQQVLTNLLINARDAMPDGGRVGIAVCCGDCQAGMLGSATQSTLLPPGRSWGDFKGTLQVSSTVRNRTVPCLVIRVSDTGEGIGEEDLGRVFDPFFTTKEPGRGTGLGLAISARIIDSLGGRITVDSVKGEGTTFSLWLPVAGGKS